MCPSTLHVNQIPVAFLFLEINKQLIAQNDHNEILKLFIDTSFFTWWRWCIFSKNKSKNNRKTGFRPIFVFIFLERCYLAPPGEKIRY
jgi:hypothetical protein